MSRVLRSLLATATAASLIAVAPAAGAHHRPNLYCSESGDICQATRKYDGVRQLRLFMAAEYFDTFRICVTGPNRSRTCERFPVGEDGNGTYGHDVDWRRNFPYEGAGAYTAVWRANGCRLGRKLGFHAR